jgi:UDP-2-acetamido-3-amino-2,3-dideoxy-glucuronate N-acetyltransferase
MNSPFKIFSDERGELIPIEMSSVPINPERIFVVSNVPKDCTRGNHAHFKTRQFIICIKGKILVGLDNGIRKEEKIITKGESVLIPEMVWDYQKFLTGDDILLAVCDTQYNKEDYILDINEFYKIIKENDLNKI